MNWMAISSYGIRGGVKHRSVQPGFVSGIRGVARAGFVTALAIVLWTGNCFSEPARGDQDAAEKLCTQFSGMLQVESAVDAWCADHQGLPESLAQLVEAEGYLDEAPEDLYAPGRPLSYRLGTGKKLGIIYSYGPDGDDDRGVSILTYRMDSRAPVPDGDIVLHVRQRHRNLLMDAVSKAGGDTQRVLDILLDIREKEGRDNAMIHYVEAVTLWPNPWNELDSGWYQVFHGINKALKKGWDRESEVLLPYLVELQPMFEKIREGSSVGYARSIGVTNGYETPYPIYLHAQWGAEMMCVRGRYLEYQRKYEDALADYLAVLTMGGDFASSGGSLLDVLISAHFQRYALGQIYRLVTTNVLDRAAMDRLNEKLREIEKTQPSIIDALWNESVKKEMFFTRIEEDPKALQGRVAEDLGLDEKILAEGVFENVDQVRRDCRRIWDLDTAYLEAHYWDRNLREYERNRTGLMEGMNPYILKHFVGQTRYSLVHEDVEYRAARAKVSLTRIVTALARYSLDHKGFPAQLSGLVPEYLESVPLDPFSGKEFFAVYSVGPDGRDDGGRVQYDPTNGTYSAGDVFLR